jgi:hypothetical protein
MEPSTAPAPPAYQLYSPRAIVAATFLGTPFTGAVLLARNERRRGETGRAGWILLLGAAGTGLLALMAMAMKGHGSIGALEAGAAAVVHQYVKQYQKPFFQAHLDLGGRAVAGWRVVLTTLGSLAVFLGIFTVGYLTLAKPWGDKLVVSGADVYYTERATVEDAKKLADGLTAIGYLHDGVAVQVRRTLDGYLVVLAVIDSAIDDHGLDEGFRQLGALVSERLGGKPVEVGLCTGDFDDIKRRFVPPKR